jgi:hypothetical protein
LAEQIGRGSKLGFPLVAGRPFRIGEKVFIITQPRNIMGGSKVRDRPYTRIVVEGRHAKNQLGLALAFRDQMRPAYAACPAKIQR